MEDFSDVDLAQVISRKNFHLVGFVLKVKDRTEASEIEKCIKANFPQVYIINVRHCEFPDKIIQVFQSEVKPHVNNNT